MPPGPLQNVRYASKKSGGKSKNGRGSAGKRLGPKKSDGNVILLCVDAMFAINDCMIFNSV